MLQHWANCMVNCDCEGDKSLTFAFLQNSPHQSNVFAGTAGFTGGKSGQGPRMPPSTPSWRSPVHVAPLSGARAGACEALLQRQSGLFHGET